MLGGVSQVIEKLWYTTRAKTVVHAQLTVGAVVIRLRPDARVTGEDVKLYVVVLEKLQRDGVPAAELKVLVIVRKRNK